MVEEEISCRCLNLPNEVSEERIADLNDPPPLDEVDDPP